jgi:hypothetical protein
MSPTTPVFFSHDNAKEGDLLMKTFMVNVLLLSFAGVLSTRQSANYRIEQGIFNNAGNPRP